MSNVQNRMINPASEAERRRAADILAIGERRGLLREAQRAVADGISLAEFQELALNQLGRVAPLNPIFTERSADIGLTAREAAAFRFLPLLNAMAHPNDQRAQEAAAFELDACRTAAARSGRTPRGVLIPSDVLRDPRFGRRDLQATATTKGAASVPTDLLGASFIELLRHRLALAQAGVTVMSDLSGNVAVPRQASSGTAYWVAEGGGLTESDFTIDQITLSPKTVGAVMDYSKQLVVQSSLDAEALVRNDLVKILALEIDRAGLYGDPAGSSHQPKGVTLTSGILKAGSGLTAFAATTPTFDELVAMETAVAAADADDASVAYLTSPTMRGALKTALKFPLALTGTDTAGAISIGGSQGPTIWSDNGTVNGTPTFVSNQIAAGDVFYGAWSNLVMGLWGGIDLVLDPYTQAPNGTIRIVVHQFVDFAVRQPLGLAYNHH